MQKYWGESGGYQYENCFMLYEKDLLTSIVKAEIEDDGDYYHPNFFMDQKVRDYDYFFLKKG